MKLRGIDEARRRRSQDRIEAIRLAHSGAQLSPTEARRLEKNLEQNPHEMSTRIRLLGYYSLAQFESPEDKDRRAKHVLWLLKHRPDSTVLFTPYVVLDTDPDAYDAGKRLWLDLVQGGAESRNLLENAAWFLARRDPALAEQMWERASATPPP